MDGLYDYILWLGDYPFSAVPFQAVDAVILCLLTYFDFSPLFEGADDVALRDCRRLIELGEVHIQGLGNADERLRILKAAAASRRFGELHMTGYVDILLSDMPIQFSAVTFHSDAGWSFIGYRGTDSTLAGWKEDFMISFTPTQAQALSSQYAQNRVNADRAWYIGGHSKGGNLALYAACQLQRDPLAAVKRVFMLDGPGFCPKALDVTEIRRVESMVTRFIPGFSVIGRLFEPQIKDTRIVRSSASGLLQHDPATWCVDHGKLATLEQTASGSDLIVEILNKWIGKMAREDREVFINDIFDALGAGGATTLEALAEEDFKGYEAMTARFKGASEISKRILKDLPHQTILSILEALFHRDKA